MTGWLVVERLEVDSSSSLVGSDIDVASVRKRFAGRELNTLDRDSIRNWTIRPSGKSRATWNRNKSRDSKGNEPFLHQFLLVRIPQNRPAS